MVTSFVPYIFSLNTVLDEVSFAIFLREDHSVVSKINADAQKGIKTKLDSDMTSWVEDSLELAKRSNGAFDPTIGRLTRLWNIEGDNPKVPSKQEIKNTLEDTGYTKIHLEKVESQNTANTKKNVDKDIKDNTAKNKEISEDTSQNTNTNESVSSIYIGDKCTLDLGAVGKGIACDVVQDYLKKQKEVGGAVIAVGGSILLYGSKADGSDWNVAVQNPRGQDGEAMGVLSLSGKRMFPRPEITKSILCRMEKDIITSLTRQLDIRKTAD